MRIITYTFCTIFFVQVSLVTSPAQQQYSYIKVQNARFILDGKPYYFVGTNFWYGCYLGSTGRTGDTSRLVRELDRLKAYGVDNLRVLGASELSNVQNSLKPAIQISPGVYDDSLLIGLDFLLSEMGKRNMYAVIFLNNYWTWSGGMYQYNSWFGGGNQSNTSPFYNNVVANDTFKAYIKFLIHRKNTVNGLFYYEDPTIMAWELANEPRPGTSTASFYNWIDSTAQYIHSLDTCHLVTTGNEGIMGSGNSPTIFLNAHQSQYIDYVTIHVWVYNWGWYNPYNSSGMYASALANATAYIQEHITLAQSLNKPLTMEEFGLPRDLMQYDAGSATTMRDQYFTALLKVIYDSAVSGSSIAGSNFWGWGGEGRSPNSDYTWRAGDPFVCDPPMEKQGLNSVYDTDSSTSQIIKNYSVLMTNLRNANFDTNKNVAKDFILYQNYPNPFNPMTTIRYDLKEEINVQIRVYNILGQQVAILINEPQSIGSYNIVFDASEFTTGVYFYQLKAGGFINTKKMLVVK